MKLKFTPLFITLIFFGAILLYLIKDQLPLFIFAFVVATVARPLYERIKKKFKGKELTASLFTTFLILLIVIVPFFLILSISINQISTLIEDFNNQTAGKIIDISWLTNFIERYSKELAGQLSKSSQISNQRILEIAGEVFAFVGDFVKNNLIPVIRGGVSLGISFVAFFFFLIFTFPAREKIVQFLENVTPLTKKQHREFITRFEHITRNTFSSTIAAMFSSGIVNGFILWILGVPYFLFWSMLLFFGAIIPFVGGLIITGIGIYLFITGQPGKGIVLLLWSNLVAANVDNYVRIANKSEKGIPMLLSLISILGGISVFGPLVGFIYGPILASFFYTAAILYQEERGNKNK